VLKGKNSMPPCGKCRADEGNPVAGISHGMHYECGFAHPLGEPCGERRGARNGECRHLVQLAECSECYSRTGPKTRDDIGPLRPVTAFPEGGGMVMRPALELADLGDDDAPSLDCSHCGRGHEFGPCIKALYLELADLGDEAIVEAPGVEPATPEFGRAIYDVACGAILDVLRDGMHGRQRNHQTRPGPSQVGGCERRLGFHVCTGIGNGTRDDTAWRPEVGTAGHAWITPWFAANPERWLAAFRVVSPVEGELDLYDRLTKTIVDFKFAGVTTRKKAEKGQVSEKYEVQLDVYGLGVESAGLPVERVALLFLPASGSLAEAVWYSRPYDRARGERAVERLRRIEAARDSGRPTEEILAGLEPTEDFCGGCPALGSHCPGAAKAGAPALTIEAVA
jgi:hypothetical protein